MTDPGPDSPISGEGSDGPSGRLGLGGVVGARGSAAVGDAAADSGSPGGGVPGGSGSGDSSRLPAWVAGLVGARAVAMLSRPGMRATAWNVVSYGGSQAIRLGSSLVLTRLLLPEHFGLMALVQALRVGLEMLSDVGIGPSIIQSSRADDPRFVNTAWTIGVVRGFVLWLLAIGLAWPLAAFFEKPELGPLFAVSAVTVAIQGMNCTAMFTLNRALSLGRLARLNLAGQVLGVVVAVVLAWVASRTPALAAYAVWSLVISAICTQLFMLWGSYRLDRSVRNRLCWDRESARQIIRFAKWIFVSTLLAFLAMQLDRLMLGKLLRASDLGIYNLAQQIGSMLPALVASMGSMVLFPLFARAARETPGELRSKLWWVRMKVLVPASAGSAGLVLLGAEVVELLFPPKFHGAGWVLEVIAAGTFMAMVNMTYNSALLGLGRSMEMVKVQAVQVVVLAGCALGGFEIARRNGYDPKLGFVLGLAATEWIAHPWVAWRARVNGVWTPGVDAVVVGIAAGAIGLALAIHALA